MHIVVNMKMEDYLKEIDYTYIGESYLTDEGFIHASTIKQFYEVSRRFNEDQHKRVIIIIDVDKLEPVVKYEEAKNGLLYPHIYGKINIESVVEVMTYEKDENNQFAPQKEYLKYEK